jgi:hypothetical protein
MDKREVLERSRAAEEDEGQDWLEDKGYEAAFLGLCATYLVLFIFNAAMGQPNEPILVLFLATQAAQTFGRYQASKVNRYRIVSILWVVATACMAAAYVVRILGLA